MAWTTQEVTACLLSSSDSTQSKDVLDIFVSSLTKAADRAEKGSSEGSNVVTGNGGRNPDEIRKVVLQILAEALCLRCPSRYCRAVLDPNPDGCCSIRCSNCGVYFCWLCFVMCVDSQRCHDHVRRDCAVNPMRGELFLPKGEKVKAHKKLRLEAIQSVLDQEFGANTWREETHEVCRYLTSSTAKTVTGTTSNMSTAATTVSVAELMKVLEGSDITPIEILRPYVFHAQGYGDREPPVPPLFRQLHHNGGNCDGGEGNGRCTLFGVALAIGILGFVCFYLGARFTGNADPTIQSGANGSTGNSIDELLLSPEAKELLALQTLHQDCAHYLVKICFYWLAFHIVVQYHSPEMQNAGIWHRIDSAIRNVIICVVVRNFPYDLCCILWYAIHLICNHWYSLLPLIVITQNGFVGVVYTVLYTIGEYWFSHYIVSDISMMAKNVKYLWVGVCCVTLGLGWWNQKSRILPQWQVQGLGMEIALNLNANDVLFVVFSLIALAVIVD